MYGINPQAFGAIMWGWQYQNGFTGCERDDSAFEDMLSIGNREMYIPTYIYLDRPRSLPRVGIEIDLMMHCHSIFLLDEVVLLGKLMLVCSIHSNGFIAS